MTFREKIETILKVNKLGVNTVYGLEAFVKASPGAISKPLNKGEEPGPGTIKKIREGLPGLNLDWWDSGKGEVFNKNGTSVHIPKENNGNSMTPRETFYTDLIENNSEYSLLPRAVLQDYKIVPDKIIDVIIASTASEKKALEDSKRMEIEGLNQKYELIITGLENKTERLEKRNKELEKENEDLRRQIPAQSKK